MRSTNLINSAVSGRLEPTVTPAQDYLAVYLNIGSTKHIKTIAAGYVPATGGTVTTGSLRIGRIKVVTGEAKPPLGSLRLDPFSPNIELEGSIYVLVDQIIRNQLVIPFGDDGLIIPSGLAATIIIGASVGEADSASAPSASYGYLMVNGSEVIKGSKLNLDLN